MCRPDLDKCLGIKNTPIRLETSCPERPKVGFGEGALSSLPPSLPGGPWSSQALFPCSTVQGHPLWAWVASPANDMAASMLDYEIFKLFSCRGYRVPPASPPALLLLICTAKGQKSMVERRTLQEQKGSTAGFKKKPAAAQCSRLVTHVNTLWPLRCLSARIGRDAEGSSRYGRR